MNKEADKQESKGFSKRAEMVKNHFQKKSGISDDAKLKIDQLAETFQKEHESLNSRIKEIRKNQENKLNDAALTSELEKLRESRNKLYEESRQSLRSNLSKDDWESVLKFLREQILAKTKRTKKSEPPKDFKDRLRSFKTISYEESFEESSIEGYSFIEYDGVNNEVWSYSETEGICPVNNQESERDYECRGASVYATLSDPQTGVAADTARGVNNAEVGLYWNPTMDGSYCVDAEHYIEPNDDYNLLYAQSSDCVGVTIPKVDIIRNGNTITNTTQEAIVGQKMDLSIAVTGGGTPSNHQWTISGEKVKNYVVNFNNGVANSAVKTDLTGQDLNQSSVQFYWLDGGDGLQVSYTATISGAAYTASATFNVKKPTVNVTTNTRSPHVYTSGQRQDLLFGDVTFGTPLPGIVFTKNNYQVPTGFLGDTVWVQTVTSTYTRTLADGQTTQTALATGLDTVFPYSQLDPNAQTTNDLPSVCLRICNDQVSISNMQVQFNAEIWLMFKPKNLPNGEESIYVPLQKVSWNWSATATRGSDFLFTLTNDGNSQNPAGIDTTTFPEWSNIVTGEEPYQ